MSKQITNASDALKALSQKIASEAAFKESGLPYYQENYANSVPSERSYVRGPDNNSMYHTHWWMMRENLRMAVGHYTVTTALEYINAGFGFQFFLHVSREDDTMVAYTPSFEAGEADKQIKTTLGKFLRKHFLVLTDAHIQTIEAAHRAELRGEVLFATTRADIQRVYTKMAGDSGCMRYNPSHFRFPTDLHPSAVYEAPGMAVAYTQDEKGVVKSRCVVWTNPDDANDKRFVRVYGDSKLLKRKLQLAGFVQAPLTGAKLARIPYPREGYSDYYVMPYLDGPGGAQSDYRGRYVRLAADDKYIEIIGAETAEQLNSLPSNSGNHAALASNHEYARVQLTPVPDTRRTCCITGKVFDMLTDRAVVFLGKDGTERTASKSGADASGLVLVPAHYIDDEGDRVKTLVSAGPTELDVAVIDVDTFMYGSLHYLKSERTYASCGMRKTSAKYYSEQTYTRQVLAVVDPTTLQTSNEFVLERDTVSVIHDGAHKFAHTSDIPALREQGFVWGSPASANRKLLLRAAAADTRKSRGGTYFHPEYCGSRFTEVHDGTWELTSRVHTRLVFGTQFSTPKAELVADSALSNEHMDACFGRSACAERIKALYGAGLSAAGTGEFVIEIQRLVKRALYDEADYCVTLTDSSGALAYASTSVDWNKLLRAIEKLRVEGPPNQTFARMVPVFDTIMRFTQPLLDALQRRQQEIDARLAAELEAARLQEEAEHAQAEAVRATLQNEIDNLLDTLDNV